VFTDPLSRHWLHNTVVLLLRALPSNGRWLQSHRLATVCTLQYFYGSPGVMHPYTETQMERQTVQGLLLLVFGIFLFLFTQFWPFKKPGKVLGSPPAGAYVSHRRKQRKLEEKLQTCQLRGGDVLILYDKCSSADVSLHTELKPVFTHLEIKIKVNVFWVVRPCSLVPVYRYFRWTCYLNQVLTMKM
jgi:hypothetical protein